MRTIADSGNKMEKLLVVALFIDTMRSMALKDPLDFHINN